MVMNAVKFGRRTFVHFRRKFNQNLGNKVRCFGSGGKLVDVQVDSDTGIYTVTLQRPPVNSLSLELVNEFITAMMRIDKERGRGMIVTSSFPGIFSAGLDLMELYKPNLERLRAYWVAIQDMWLKLYGSTYSTVAVIRGHAPGAGCLISISCDHRIMVNGKYGIGLNETQLGLAAPSWFIDTFRNVLPLRVSEMALISGKLFSVEEALRVGLIDEVATNDTEALSMAEAYITQLSKLPAYGLGQTKLTIRYDAVTRLQENRENDLRVFKNFVSSPETQKGLEMYLESLQKKK